MINVPLQERPIVRGVFRQAHLPVCSTSLRESADAALYAIIDPCSILTKNRGRPRPGQRTSSLEHVRHERLHTEMDLDTHPHAEITSRQPDISKDKQASRRRSAGRVVEVHRSSGRNARLP